MKTKRKINLLFLIYGHKTQVLEIKFKVGYFLIDCLITNLGLSQLYNTQILSHTLTLACVILFKFRPAICYTWNKYNLFWQVSSNTWEAFLVKNQDKQLPMSGQLLFYYLVEIFRESCCLLCFWNSGSWQSFMYCANF